MDRQTKEVRTFGREDPCGHRRLAAIDGWVCTGRVEKDDDVLFRLPKTSYFCTRYGRISITEACSLRYARIYFFEISTINT